MTVYSEADGFMLCSDDGVLVRPSRLVATALAAIALFACGLFACLLLMLGPLAVEYVALGPLSARLGTERSKLALVDHVTEGLMQQKGLAREDVHRWLDALDDGFEVKPAGPVAGQPTESVYWTLAGSPDGLKIWAVWTLYYDEQNRLKDVQVGEFP